MVPKPVPNDMKKALSFGTLMGLAHDHDDEGTDAISKETVQRVMEKVNAAFPGALTDHQLAFQLSDMLGQYGYNKKATLLCTSLCCDEANRDLEDELRARFDSNYSMGGLAGFPFGGLTAWGSMAHNIPLGGSCVVVYGPHVGIDWDGTIGKVNRRGHPGSGACCGPANAALAYVQMVRAGERQEADIPDSIIDAQQTWIEKTLLKYGERLETADDVNVELPHSLFDAQNDVMNQIVSKACGEVRGDGKIALVGGIQINTPQGTPSYFVPKRFDLLNNKGELIENLLPSLHEAHGLPQNSNNW